jgi:protein-S-isoprenylcysteine O-methyltransferase Ste14
MSKKVISALLVIIQFGCLLFLFLTGPLIVRLSLFPFELIALLIGFWSVWNMRISRLNIFPEVLNGAKLIQQGPYKYIRHPMYFSVILLSIVLIINHFQIDRLIISFALAFNLIFKIEWEERILSEEFREYYSYRKSTWKLIPWIY